MPLPAPEPGLVISFSYLWRHEHRSGESSGRKNRPCVLVSAAEETPHGLLITVTPITHQSPENATDAIEIPAPVKRHLRLDRDRSWVVVTEANRFIWPGFDLHPIPGTTDRYDYGFIPRPLFKKIKAALLEQLKARHAKIIKRD